MKNFSYKLIYTLIFLFSFEASAQMTPPPFMEIFEGNSVTKEQYDEFWSEVGVRDKEEKMQVIKSMRDSFLLSQDYQREIWVCAQEAWNLRKIPQCKEAQKKLELLKANFKKMQQDVSLDDLEKLSNNILEAASNHSDFEIEGVKKPLSLQMIKYTGRNLDNMFAKFDQILQAEYVE